MIDYLLPTVIICLLVILNGLFVAAEFSIVAAPYTRIAQIANRGSNTARQVLEILRHPDKQNRYLATAQVGITIASLGLGMYGEHAIADWIRFPLESLGVFALPLAHTISIVLSIGFLTYIHVVIGEMVPKTLALQSATSMVLRLQKPMAITERIFLPIIRTLNGIANAIMQMIGIQSAESGSRLMSPDELELIVEESFESGLIESDEQLFIENIFDLSERKVGQVMTPRTRIQGIPINFDEVSTLNRVCQARASRFPVFEESIDRIIGILHVKDLARYRLDPTQPFDLQEMLRPALFVPESLSLEELLIRFRQEGIQMAIVIDEFGGTSGLVTIEDLVEEVVGEIQDEFDREIPPIQQLETGKLRVRGDLLLDELNQHHDLNLHHKDADTVGGFLMVLLGRVLHSGDEIETNGVKFEVEAVNGLEVQTVLVDLLQKNIITGMEPSDNEMPIS